MGLATARIMGRDHRVVISDVSRERLDQAVEQLRGLGIDASSAVCDITDRGSVDALFAQAEDGGHVRAVVHTAGVSPLMGDAEFIARTNAVGTVNVVESYLVRAAEGDALVAVASVAGHMGPGFLLPKRAFRLARTDLATFHRKLLASTAILPKGARAGVAYTTSKAFVIWYAREMAADFGAKGARIVSVSPGTFDTAMGRLEEKSGSGKLVDLAALKRFGRPEEVAEVLAFAASDKPGYLTGTDILVDGGTTAGMGWRDIVNLARRS
jgi:NAD(P)-dependent dehydrogenase (short-subunit alcohol dehydrogenase family)